MATGPEHYRHAENALSTAASSPSADHADMLIARAQVHATLALAAAQIEDMDSGFLRPGWADIVDGPQ